MPNIFTDHLLKMWRKKIKILKNDFTNYSKLKINLLSIKFELEIKAGKTNKKSCKGSHAFIWCIWTVLSVKYKNKKDMSQYELYHLYASKLIKTWKS